MTEFLSIYSAKDFRSDVIEVALNGIKDVIAYPENDEDKALKVETFQDIISNLDNSTVYHELTWSLCNVVEIIIHKYLVYKGFCDDEDWTADCSFHSGYADIEVLQGETTVEYGVDALNGIEEPVKIFASFEIPVEDFLNKDGEIELIINSIIEEVDAHLEPVLSGAVEVEQADAPQLNIITVYSLRECCFIVVATDLTDEQVEQEMKKFRDENPDDDVADFSFEMGLRKGITWNEIGDSAIDFENLGD